MSKAYPRMEIRVSDPLDVSEFRVCLASFANFDCKWSEVQAAARDLVVKFPHFMFRFELRF